jgi:GntR family transcriptional regulator, transcriptional repressor for pyruvate dehydrogenase complex
MTAEPVRQKDDLTNRLIDALQDLISEGVLLPGTKLPPERELAPRFGVSRSSLRHALKALEHMGILYQRVGDGTYVRESCEEILSRPLELLILLDGISASELLETRLIVEPELAARAAERATSSDLEALNQTIEEMHSRKEQQKFNELDIAFHQGIFVASGNRLSQRIFPIIQRAMLRSITITSTLVDAEHTLSFHKPIYNAIYRRQPAEARAKMIAHLQDARRLLAKAGKRPQPETLLPSFRPIGRQENL